MSLGTFYDTELNSDGISTLCCLRLLLGIWLLPEACVCVVEGVLALAVQLGLAPGELCLVHGLLALLVHPLPALAAVLHQEPPAGPLPAQDGHPVQVVSRDS